MTRLFSFGVFLGQTRAWEPKGPPEPPGKTPEVAPYFLTPRPSDRSGPGRTGSSLHSVPFDDCQSAVVVRTRRGVLRTTFREAKKRAFGARARIHTFRTTWAVFSLRIECSMYIVCMTYDVERWRHVSVREAQCVNAATRSRFGEYSASPCAGAKLKQANLVAPRRDYNI